MSLEEYLKSTGITSSGLGASAGVPTPCITRYLKKLRGLSPKSASKISHATNGRVSIQELLFPGGIPDDLPRARVARKP